MNRLQTDQQILLAMKVMSAGDPTRAWLEWDRRHGQRAFGVATRVLRRGGLPSDLAEDVVQQAALQFLTHIDQIDPVRPPLSYYLAIVHNLAVDLVRDEFRFRQALKCWPSVEDSSRPENVVARRQQVAEVLSLVSPECREILTAHYLHNKSAKEIAVERGVPVAHVYRVLHRGRTQVRGCAARSRRTQARAA